MSGNADLNRLPAPFSSDSFVLHRRGVFDDPSVDVYVNEQRDFAFLSPQPETNYAAYRPRSQRLSLEGYRARNEVIERRFAKLADLFTEGVHDVLEVGASDGAFLARVRDERPDVRIACVEPDLTTEAARQALVGLQHFPSIIDAAASGRVFDRVCLFHVLEHIIDPVPFLAACHGLLRRDGLLIVEVPSLDDPLLSLYEAVAYDAFYFQLQHPYVYTAASLSRLLAGHGFAATQLIAHQRYGLENHLTWLAKGVPGGDESLRALFTGFDADYRSALERAGASDAVIAIARSDPSIVREGQ